jgi:hypothetical protein
MESELAAHDSALATKADLLGGLQGLELKLDDRIQGVGERIHGLELKLEAQRGELRTEMQALRGELIGEIKGTVRWNFAFWIAQLAAIAGILKLLK